MAGKIDVEGLAQCSYLQKCRDAAAARHVRLLNIDGMRFKHLADIFYRVGIFAGCDVHSGGSALANRAQPAQIVRRHRLLEPADLLLGETCRKLKCLLD